MTKIPHRVTCEFSRSLDPEEIDSNKADYIDALLLKYKQQKEIHQESTKISERTNGQRQPVSRQAIHHPAIRFED